MDKRLVVFSLLVVAAAAFALSGRPQGDQDGGGPAPFSPGATAPQDAAPAEDAAPAAEAAAFPETEDLRRRCQRRARDVARQLDPTRPVIVADPFVVAGDLSELQLRRWLEQTIQPAAEAMANSYFGTPPDEAITILLFANQESYRHYADKLYGDRDISIYGYYKPHLRTLVMNIGTGGGTLVHELTHALIAFDFPQVPDWFNEGLASLHEQCRFRRRENRQWLEGQSNWRLPILQEALRSGRVRTVRQMLRDPDFRRDPGLNYAQARYFCLFLQQQGWLEDFYRRFRDGYREDPLGEKALRAAASQASWSDLERQFRQWAAALLAQTAA